MCSIFGVVGVNPDMEVLRRIAERAKDRGRDGGQMQRFDLSGGQVAYLGNWRATPTTEVWDVEPQPYDGVIHNGTIANDVELGALPGEVDSMVLPRVIDRSNLDALTHSLGKVQGSYAMAIVSPRTVYAAVNYKPLHLLRIAEAVYFSSMERHLLPECGFGLRPGRVLPYTVTDLLTGDSRPIPRESTSRALVVCSGGLDSTTVAYDMANQGYEVDLLHFRYGCRAETREATLVQKIANHLRREMIYLDIDYSSFTGQSPLLTDNSITQGKAGAEYAHEWVPARNLLMIAHAVAYAEANGYSWVAIGNNLEESGAFPDNEEEFTNLLGHALDYAVHDGGQVRLISPVGGLMKHEIVKLGAGLGVPYELTWSCYYGREVHCGDCGPCFMRRTAFERNGLTDPVFA